MGLFGFLTKNSASRDEFAQLLIQHLKQHGETRSIQYRPEDFVLKIDQDQVALSNYFQQFKEASAAEHDKVMTEIREDLQPPPSIDSYSDVKHLLQPVLRSLMLSSNKALALKAEGVNTGDELLFPLAGDFAIGIVIDRPRLMQTVVMENVRSWKVSIEQIREDAMRNLSKNSQPQFKQIEAGIYQTAWDDGYDASRILLPSVFSAIEPDRKIIVAPMSADMMIVANSNKPETIEKLIAEVYKALHNNGKSLSPCLLSLEENNWREVKLPLGHPSTQAYSELKKLWLNQAYSSQQTALQKIYHNEEKDPFISTYNLAKKNGHIVSYVGWTEGIGVPLWLPKTDTVILVPEGGEPIPIDWTRLQNITGLISDTPVISNPDRFAVSIFPNSEQLKALVQ